ncbi:hypothetical protein SAMN04488689_107158 [Paenibacillus sp. cl6col]|uniref:hypothetical protein n=2 Tax=Paenibacillus TaxID=44249 RepID=UPI0003862354|nr:hypothetical protein [Paenibacillus sp. cl6col]EPY11656.1 hypothetical protein PAAL66ix_17067 [Paenibacillus alvei A6-6i-x]SDF83332.1 hypothetical protein SAMN04488689_107158 [Paenibacillus sp. cl6col]
MIDFMEKATTRISKIAWGTSETKKKSSELLITEYLRRSALFLEGYSFESGPFFSPAKVVGSNLDLEDIIAGIFFESGRPNLLCKTICLRYLEWVSLVEEGKIISDEYQDIYEPLIKYFERGGTLRLDQGIYLDYGFGAFPIDNWRERYSKLHAIDISDVNLDKVDIESY